MGDRRNEKNTHEEERSKKIKLVEWKKSSAICNIKPPFEKAFCEVPEENATPKGKSYERHFWVRKIIIR